MKKKFLYIIFIILSSFCLVELSVRFINPSKIVFNDAYSLVQFINFDPTFNLQNASMIMQLEPSADHLGYFGDVGIKISFDQYYGRYFEDTNRSLKKNIALVLGDSFAFGYGVRYKDSLFGLMDQYKESRSYINLAKPGFDLDNIYNFLQAWLAKFPDLKFDQVIYGLNMNDILAFDTNLFSTHQNNSYLLPLRQELHSLDFLLYLLERSKVSNSFIHNMNNLTDEVISEKLTKLNEIKAIILNKGAKLVVVIYPVLYKARDRIFADTYSKIAKLIKALDIPVVDLTSGFSKEDSMYWIHRYDQHPNSKANRIFFNHLLQSEILNK